ncbi:RidA family protein [Nocardia huaxiensis]|uniref:RidA family protein n=1 Tax=Nocardia huaxiensis TaxID=2755382 RepID=A0A7D6VGR0_9NOCA|nr:RidA family protein [Nocardia huaxiensis]QLY32437.1 RidA family protein [Nocardia huaxiensis]UFS93857.1 RidA family protein [Nocardia huaxiensis]
MSLTTFINPESMPSNPAFTQAVRVSAAADTVYVGGQHGVDGSGQVVGPDLKSQARQALLNVATCVEAAGGTVADIVKWTIFFRDDQPAEDGFAAYIELWGMRPNPPAITVVQVSGFARPGIVCEIEAVAAIPAQ